MGNYIHKVPSNSHTSGATVCDGGHTAALPAGDSDSRGLEQEPLPCPRCPPAPSYSAFCPARSGWAACRNLRGKRQHHSLPRLACLYDGAENGGSLLLLLTQAMQMLTSRHRGGQSRLKDSRGKLVFPLQPGIPHAQGWNEARLWEFPAGFVPHQVSFPSQRGADLCTDTGKLVEEHSGCGAQQPPACRHSHTG